MVGHAGKALGDTVRTDREPQVTGQIHRLDSLILEVGQVADQLHDRLMSILIQPTPPEISPDKKPEGHLVPLADTLRQYNSRLANSLSQLTYMLDNIEL